MEKDSPDLARSIANCHPKPGQDYGGRYKE